MNEQELKRIVRETIHETLQEIFREMYGEFFERYTNKRREEGRRYPLALEMEADRIHMLTNRLEMLSFKLESWSSRTKCKYNDTDISKIKDDVKDILSKV